MVGQRLRVRLKSYDHVQLEHSVEMLIGTVRKTGAEVAGPVPLPTSTRKYCVLRSPHGDKKSREAFEMRTHKRLVDILEPTPETMELLAKLTLPAGVDVSVEVMEG